MAGVVLMSAALTGEAQAQFLDEGEPNNSTETATVLPPLPLIEVRGIMDFTGLDLDFFQIDLVNGNTVRVDLTAGGDGQNFEGRIQVLNASGTILAENVVMGSSKRISVTLVVDGATPPGIGYVRISNDLIGTGTATYDLSIANGVAEIEPNDDLATAQLVTPGISNLGQMPLDSTTNDDFFRFTTSQPDQTVVLLCQYSLGEAKVLGLQLLDDDGDELAIEFRNNRSGFTKNPSIVRRLAQPGTYFARVFLADTADAPRTLAYAVSLALKTGSFEEEPNQSFREAAPVSISSQGTSIGGILQSGRDVDVFKVSLPGGTALVADLDTLSTLGIMDGVVSTFLQEDLGDSFASNDDNSILPPGATVALLNRDGYVRVVPPRSGEVFIAVADRASLGGIIGFDYQLKLKAVTPPPAESEPNDSAAAADALVNGQVVRGIIGTASDTDHYSMAGLAGQSMLVNINAFGIGSFLNARLILTDPNGVVVSDTSAAPFSPDPFVLLASLPSTGTYGIEIRRAQATSGNGPSFYYELRADVSSTVSALVRNPDIDASGRVDGFDLAVLARIFGLGIGDPGFDPAADIFPDDSIDGLDLSVLGDFFGGILGTTGLAEVISDPAGDGSPYFGPTESPSDLIGLGISDSGGDTEVSVFFADPLGPNSGGILSIDADFSALTGTLSTPDTYLASRSLGSEVEITFSSQGFNVFSVPDARTDIYEAFIANVGDSSALEFPGSVAQRNLPRATLLVSSPDVNVGGNQLSFTLPAAQIGDLAGASAAALGVAVIDSEPTDRLPNTGAVRLRTPQPVGNVTVTQMLCQNDNKILCDPATADADCGVAGAICVDADSSNILPTQSVVYMRTPRAAPVFGDIERGIFLSNPTSDTVCSSAPAGCNDTLNRIFPLGTRPVNPPDIKWFTRDLLYNFGARAGEFDPHTQGTPPPDVDHYYFLGGLGDRAVVDLVTPDQGATFDSQIQVFLTPLPLATLDPSSSARLLTVTESQLVLVAANDDRSGVDLDPRIDTILGDTGIYVVRITASPKQTTFPGSAVGYILTHESLRPDEVSVPIVIRGPYQGNNAVSGLNFEFEYDPSVVQVTGVDLQQGTRLPGISGDLNASNPQEIVVSPVPGTPGRSRFAVRSFRGDGLSTPNGYTGNGSFEITVARLRFRGVAPGTTRVNFAQNPTTSGERLVNLAIRSNQPRPTIFTPFNGYGPGVTITVDPAP